MKPKKVIKALKICDGNDAGIVCKKCPYRDKRWDGAWVEDNTGRNCYDKLRKDAVKLLRESI